VDYHIRIVTDNMIEAQRRRDSINLHKVVQTARVMQFADGETGPVHIADDEVDLFFSFDSYTRGKG